MDMARFKNSPSGQLIRVGHGEPAYWAFVPCPLPPALPADWALSRSVSEADRALSELAGLGRTIPNPHLLIGPFVRREAVLSSRIEGTRADITDLYAYEAGQLPLPLLYLSAFFHRHRQQYYDLLLEISAGGAWQGWVRFFLRGVAEQAQDAIARARRLQELQTAWRERLTQARTSALLLRLVDSLFESPILTIPDAQQRLEVTYRTAQRNVNRLVTVGILHQAGETSYGKTYVATEILQVIGEQEP